LKGYPGALFGLALFSLVAVLIPPQTSAQPTEHRLGTPVRAMTIWGQLLVTDDQTGRPVFYAGTYTGAGNSRLIRFDYARNEVDYFPLPGTKGAYGLCEGEDGTIYMGTVDDGKIFSFDPLTGEITDHGSAAGEQYVWTLHIGPDGRIYGATYPNAKVVVYDPEEDEIHDLGRMHPTEQYCRDLAVADNGRIFCGIGSHADIIAYDPDTHERTSILPERYKWNSFAYTMESEHDLVYAFLHFEEIVLIFDANSYELLSEVRHPDEGGVVSIHRQRSGGPVLISGLPGGYHRYNSTSGEVEPYHTPSSSFYDNSTGISYGRTNGGQVFVARNLTSGEELARVDVSQDGEGMGIFSLGTGPDGCIYGGVYNLLHLFRYDPQNDTLEDLGVPIPGASGEFYSFCSHKGKLYMASYTHSILSVYDPDEPWHPGTDVGDNPRKIGSVGEEQYRPPALVAASDGCLYIGSLPAYGKMGGAMSVYDPDADEFRVHRNIIPNQSVVSLTTGADGWTVYGGSSIQGGGGTTPVATEAHFFAWSIGEGRKILDMVPFPGEDSIDALATAPDGRIHGFSGSRVFVYDPAAGEIIYTDSIGTGTPRKLLVLDDGLIYGISSSALFRMEPLSSRDDGLGIERLSSGGTDLAIDHDGVIYLARDIDLYRLDGVPPIQEPESDLPIYSDGLEPDWTLQSSGADVDSESRRKVDRGTCQEITFDRFCSLQYTPSDPWSITLWNYNELCFSINPGNASLTDIVVAKTGSGAGRPVSVGDMPIELTPDTWTKVRMPISDLEWYFGSRLESLKLTVLGTGTFYLDSISLEVRDLNLMGMVLALFAGILVYPTVCDRF